MFFCFFYLIFLINIKIVKHTFLNKYNPLCKLALIVKSWFSKVRLFNNCFWWHRYSDLYTLCIHLLVVFGNMKINFLFEDLHMIYFVPLYRLWMLKLCILPAFLRRIVFCMYCLSWLILFIPLCWYTFLRPFLVNELEPQHLLHDRRKVYEVPCLRSSSNLSLDI